MSLTVVWVDPGQAKLFHFSEDRMQREILPAPPNDSNFSSLFSQIIQKLSLAKKVLLLGPGNTKEKLLELLNQSHAPLAKKVVGCEDSDHPSDHQIAAYATKYLQKPVA